MSPAGDAGTWNGRGSGRDIGRLHAEGGVTRGDCLRATATYTDDIGGMKIPDDAATPEMR